VLAAATERVKSAEQERNTAIKQFEQNEALWIKKMEQKDQDFGKL
jgi:hypothetical protein